MIKPTDLDFTSPEAVLLSSEAARFAGYDLEKEGAGITHLKDTPEFTLIEVGLTSVRGAAVKRKVVAYKNPEDESGAGRDLVLTVTQGTHDFEHLNFNLALNNSMQWLNGRFFWRVNGSDGDYQQHSLTSANSGFWGIALDPSSTDTAYQVYFEVDVEGEVVATTPIVIQRPAKPMSFVIENPPEVIHELTTLNLVFTPADHQIDYFSFSNNGTAGIIAYRTQGNEFQIVVDPELVEDLAELHLTVNVDGVEVSFNTIYEKTDVEVS